MSKKENLCIERRKGQRKQKNVYYDIMIKYHIMTYGYSVTFHNSNIVLYIHPSFNYSIVYMLKFNNLLQIKIGSTNRFKQ